MKIDKVSFWIFIIAVFLVLTFQGCQIDSQSDKTTDAGGDSVHAANVEGYWLVKYEVSDNCSGITETKEQTEIYSVEQNDGVLKITIFPNGDIIDGRVIGNTLEWSGTLPASHDTQVEIDFAGAINSLQTNITGRADWTWSDGISSCSGTSQIISGIKVNEEDQDFSGVWNGAWTSEEYSLTGIFVASVTQNGHILGGTIDIPDRGIEDAELTGEVHGNFVYFGDIDRIIKFVGIIDNNEAQGTYCYNALSDEGTWGANRSQ